MTGIESVMRPAVACRLYFRQCLMALSCHKRCRQHANPMDPGDRIGNRMPKEKQRQNVPQRNIISLRFCACTRHYLCSYILNFSSGEEATHRKNEYHIFWCVKITIIGLRKRRKLVPRPKVAWNATAV